jgi:nicotinate-nucleotide pyrophosphorylase (carboxylating)
MFLPRKVLEEKLHSILTEDLGQGDVTTELLIPKQSTSEAEIVAREVGTAAGLEEAQVLLESLGLEVESLAKDGDKVRIGQKLLKINGDTRTTLSAERTTLNIVSRMSGIATATRNTVDRLRKAKLKTKVACTRKTAPGLMYFDKKAVKIGGGDTHRFHLDDLILIKDNHITVAGGIEKALAKAKEKASFSKKIEIEVTKPENAVFAATTGADIVMLDNFSPTQIEKTIDLLKKASLLGKVLLEASGGITSENALKYAASGVDIISLGEITHSPKALNISLEIIKTKKV